MDLRRSSSTRMKNLHLFGPKRAIGSRHSFARVFAAALCVLLVLAVAMRSDSVLAPRHLFAGKGIKSTRAKHRPVDDAGDDDDGPLRLASGRRLMNCSVDLPHLRELQRRHGLADKIQYMRRYVSFRRRAGLARARMTSLSQKLLTAPLGLVDLNQRPPAEEECPEPLEVDVPVSGLPSTVNASDFIFGVSTSYQRFMDPEKSPVDDWIFWLTDNRGRSNGAKLLLMLLDATDDELQEVANLLGDVGIDVDLYHSDASLEMAVRYFSLVPTLVTHIDAPSKKWFVTCDDDTFFPSMHGLVERIGALDDTKEMYVGTLSEDVGAIERHGSQAFGGAGVFLSKPMAERIAAMYDACTTEEKVLESNSGWGPQGDILLRKCIYENTETRLTTVWDLWQLDFMGHPAGFYEWGIKPLSLHHFRGWHKAKPGEMAKIAHTCGEDCTMMRFRTADNFVLSGYSVAHYPEGLTADFDQLEATLWPAPENKGWNLDFAFGPQRKSLERTGRKISWELQESAVHSDGSVVQTFTRKKDDSRWVDKGGRPMSDSDGVFELVWIPSSS
ncbi:glycosyltransferase family 31 protein [Drechmeria coniospora]|uniref:Glycosyltransferase family 31 protein n=1 Tax=Drechmeria coniospora TaxID=98403 RepID=A0A151GGS4_DRECN|nr:glycosyltransferase family 31 protein [Drechmeria coniospora]KYK56307.1 glycosyltransferase family 31 protein [Drechmeria coniospora]